MILPNKIVVGLAIFSLMFLSSVGKRRKTVRAAEKKHLKTQVQTWEGEGGNLLPASTTSTATSTTPAVVN